MSFLARWVLYSRFVRQRPGEPLARYELRFWRVRTALEVIAGAAYVLAVLLLGGVAGFLFGLANT